MDGAKALGGIDFFSSEMDRFIACILQTYVVKYNAKAKKKVSPLRALPFHANQIGKILIRQFQITDIKEFSKKQTVCLSFRIKHQNSHFIKR